jgi:hypothetical protein
MCFNLGDWHGPGEIICQILVYRAADEAGEREGIPDKHTGPIHSPSWQLFD